jgi:hypothetical protein
MSGMRGMLAIALYRDAPLPTSRILKGNRRSRRSDPEKQVTSSFSSLREELSLVWRDAQYAAHAERESRPS